MRNATQNATLLTRYRQRYDIIADILQYCQHGADAPSIKLKCNVNYEQISTYVTRDLKYLLEAVDAKYYTNKLGLRFLAIYKEIKQIVP